MRITKKRLNKIRRAKNQSRKKYKKRKKKYKKKRRSFRKRNKYNLRKKSLKYRGGATTKVYYLVSDMYIKFKNSKKQDKSGDPNKFFIIERDYDKKNKTINKSGIFQPILDLEFTFPEEFRVKLEDKLWKNRPLVYFNIVLIHHQQKIKSKISKEKLKQFIDHFMQKTGNREKYIEYFNTYYKKLQRDYLRKMLANINISQSEYEKWNVSLKDNNLQFFKPDMMEEGVFGSVNDVVQHEKDKMKKEQERIQKEQERIQKEKEEQQRKEAEDAQERERKEQENRERERTAMESQETQQREQQQTIKERKAFEELMKKNITDKLQKINQEIDLLKTQTFTSGENTEKILPDTDNKKLENILQFIQKVPFVKDIPKEELQAVNEKLRENKLEKDKILQNIQQQKELWELTNENENLKISVDKAYNDLKTDLDNAFVIVEKNTSSAPMAAASIEPSTKKTFLLTEQYEKIIKLKNFWKKSLDRDIVNKDEIVKLLNLIEKDLSTIVSTETSDSKEVVIDKLKSGEGLYILLNDLENVYKDLYLQAYLNNLFTMVNMKKPKDQIVQALSYIYTFLEIWNFSSNEYDIIIDIEKKSDIPMVSRGYRSENNLVLRLKYKKSGVYKQDIVLTLYANKRDFNSAINKGTIKLYKPSRFSGNLQGFAQSYTSNKKYEFISPELIIGNDPSTKNLLDEKYKSVVGGLKSSVDNLETNLKSGNYNVDDIAEVVQIYNTLVSDDGTNIKKYTKTDESSVDTETPTETPTPTVESGQIRTDEQKLDDQQESTDSGAEIPPPTYEESQAQEREKANESQKSNKPEETADIYKEKPKKKKDIPPIATISNLNDTGGTSANLYISMNPNRENSLGENVPGIIKLYNKNDSSTQSVAGWIKNLGATEVETETMGSNEPSDAKIKEMEDKLKALSTDENPAIESAGEYTEL